MLIMKNAVQDFFFNLGPRCLQAGTGETVQRLCSFWNVSHDAARMSSALGNRPSALCLISASTQAETHKHGTRKRGRNARPPSLDMGTGWIRSIMTRTAMGKSSSLAHTAMTVMLKLRCSPEKLFSFSENEPHLRKDMSNRTRAAKSWLGDDECSSQELIGSTPRPFF